MKHARADYDRIQDPTERIPHNEPVFLIRGQDIAGPDAVRAYAMLAHKLGAANELVTSCLDQAREMELWQARVARKTPDL